jgi:hypothetical protein
MHLIVNDAGNDILASAVNFNVGRGIDDAAHALYVALADVQIAGCYLAPVYQQAVF